MAQFKVLREGGDPVKGTYKPLHQCPVYGGKSAADSENGKIIQCECGRKYVARESLLVSGTVVWKQKWF